MKMFEVYSQYDIEPVKAKGCWITDKKGKKYLDLYGGHAVISVGHSHPYYLKKIKKQIKKIGYYSNSVKSGLQNKLANKLGRISGYPSYNLFLCNSGAEANENALKLASFHNGRKKIIAFKHSFHGRTSLALAATDNAEIQAPVNLTKNVIFVPLNDLAKFEKAMNSHDICAVIIEGIQGVGGINVPDPKFLSEVGKVCKKEGALLILDEVQSGCARTGKFFAHQRAKVKPDLITVAKGMGNGFPIGGVLISPEIKARTEMLGSTFGGNHLACAASIAVIDIIEKEGLLKHSREMGKYVFENLRKMKAIKEVRGAGLMIGIDLGDNTIKIRNELLSKFRIFTGISHDKKTLRILPPLTVTKKEIKIFLNAFKEIMQNLQIKSE